MIQRIQTVYLALATLLTSLLVKGHIVKLVGPGGEDFRLIYKGLYDYSGTVPDIVMKSLPLALLTVAVAIMFFMAIFLYKRRKLQIRLTLLTTLLNLGILLLVLFYTFYTGSKLEAQYIFNIKMVFPLASSVLGYLAFRGILKDELLVRSYDRIR